MFRLRGWHAALTAASLCSHLLGGQAWTTLASCRHYCHVAACASGSSATEAAEQKPPTAYQLVRETWLKLVPDKSKRVLITGIGDDESLPHMLQDGYTNVIGLNATPELLAIAESLLATSDNENPEHQVRLHSHSLRHLEELLPARSVDAILDCERYHLTTGKSEEARAAYLAEVTDQFRTVLVRKGIVVGAWRPPVCEAEIRKAFRAGAWRAHIEVSLCETPSVGTFVMESRPPNPWLSADKHSC
eukprot:TRINITY_DN13633_c0_g1_i1.p1 TRINITY_DN13633_c0_g1~~TRINITY_DN13633_c0_g1_i1.p1  ORF type:complete len:270 (-),score=22.63 TRINITY_DN13633_c0_g1_i1:181-918(-)